MGGGLWGEGVGWPAWWLVGCGERKMADKSCGRWGVGRAGWLGKEWDEGGRGRSW